MVEYFDHADHLLANLLIDAKRSRVDNSNLVINGELSNFKTQGADFRGILTDEGQVYFDRTRYISVLNRFKQSILFFRPRRFGKSLTVRMLEHFHGLQYRDDHKSIYQVRDYVPNYSDLVD